MRRSELIEGARNVLLALDRSNLVKLLETTLRRDAGGKTINNEILGALNRYSIEASKFNKVEKQIATILHLDLILQVERWLEVAAQSPMTYEIRAIVTQAVEFLPKFLNLVTQDHVEVMKHDPSNAPTELQGKALISVILIEENGKFSSPKRVIETLEAVQLLYESVAILQNHQTEQQLILLACDSGSDKSFDLLGIAKLVEAVKEIILSLWDRVVFYREKKLDAKLGLIAQTLPIIEKISQMEKAGHLEREQAGVLRKNIGLGAEKFLNAGAIIPEVEKHSSFNPRQLMAPEPKLLAVQSEPTPQSPEENAVRQQDAGEELNAEERAELEKFFKEMKKGKKKKRSEKPDNAGEAS